MQPNVGQRPKGEGKTYTPLALAWGRPERELRLQMRCVDSDSNKLRMLEVSECRTPRGHVFGRRSPEMERAGGGSIGLHVAFPLEAGIPKGEGLLAGLMRRKPSWGVNGGRKFNQSPEVSVGAIQQLVSRP